MKNKPIRLLGIIAVLVAAFFIVRLIWPPGKDVPLDVVVEVDPSHFIEESLVKPIERKVCRLADGSEAECYVITCKSIPTDHDVGPWAPKHVDDGPEKGGIWIKDGHVYDCDGQFVAHIGELYNDPRWDLVREDGSVKVTETREAFNLAARPNVDPRYHNHVVECPPEVDEWKDDHKVYVIPVRPVYRSVSTNLRVGAAGLALNGVTFDPPAPIHAIIGAHTIAPFDKAGGHVNPHVGYHYHAATGKTKEIQQADGHAPLIGYALDGFGIYAHLDTDGNPPKELDDCRGHYDDVRGYHYHADKAGNNQIIGAFRGRAGSLEILQIGKIAEGAH